MTLFSRLTILKAIIEKKRKFSIYYPWNNILYSSVCFFVILLCIGITVSHGQTLPGDQIISYRILDKTYNPKWSDPNFRTWSLKIEVNYAYNVAHGYSPGVLGRLAPVGPGVQTGFNGMNCGTYNQTQQGNIIYGTQTVNVYIASTNTSITNYHTNTLVLWLNENGNNIFQKDFPLQMAWNFNQAQRTEVLLAKPRIKYTIQNNTHFNIHVKFLLTGNTDTLAPGKKINCNSAIKNGKYPQVMATGSPDGIASKITIKNHGGDYYIILSPSKTGRPGVVGIDIVPGKK
jgi:hypothetical protein